MVEHKCPRCNSKTSTIHDYRTREFKYGTINQEKIIIEYKRRRYKCKSCNKKLPENNQFINRYAKISNKLNDSIIKELTNKKTFKHIATDNNVSSSTVIRRSDKHYKILETTFPKVISIDEFKKSNSSGKNGKYALMIADPINKKIIDILPDRRKNKFDQYLTKVPHNVLNDVKIVIIDMWEPYKDLVYEHFPNANIVIDRFHFIRHLIWALTEVRVKVMNKYSANQKGYSVLKKFHKLLLKNPNDISNMFYDNYYFKKLMSESTIIDECLSIDPELEKSYRLYEKFQKETSKQFNSFDEAITFLNSFINELFSSKIDEFIPVATMFINWKKEIVNSLVLSYEEDSITKRYTNGFIEGVNNYIKTFRRMCFNIRNFKRFKTRIITTFNQEFMLIA